VEACRAARLVRAVLEGIRQAPVSVIAVCMWTSLRQTLITGLGPVRSLGAGQRGLAPVLQVALLVTVVSRAVTPILPAGATAGTAGVQAFNWVVVADLAIPCIPSLATLRGLMLVMAMQTCP
jgi:hypothetical protein